MDGDNSMLLKIFNNSEKEIYSSTIDERKEQPVNVKVSEFFSQPGLYYWRIESEEEVLYVGKFYFLSKF
jgi:hypothetical protein